MSLVPSWTTSLFAVGWFSRRPGIFSARSFTVAPGKHKVFADFFRISLMMESRMISIVGTGDSDEGVSVWETLLVGRAVVVVTTLSDLRDDFSTSLGQEPPERLITASFNILCWAEDVFTRDGAVDFALRSHSGIRRRSHRSFIQQGRVAVGKTQERWWGSTIWLSIVTADHHLGSGRLLVRCWAGRELRTGGGVPWHCVLTGSTELSNPSGLPRCHLHEASQKRAFLLQFFRKTANVLLKVGDLFVWILEQCTVPAGQRWHFCKIQETTSKTSVKVTCWIS